MLTRKACKYRLYPTHSQEQALHWTLARCRELYNVALQERRDAYRMRGVSIRCYDQINQLPSIKAARPEYADIHSQVLQDVLRRVDKAMQAFFRRGKLGQKPGYPRFQGRNRYDSFTYPQAGFALAGERLTLSKMGDIKVRLHRPMVGQVKTCTIKRDADQWYVCFSCEVEEEALPPSDEAIGIDLGLLHFATLSTGETIENPRYYRKGRKKLALAQQKVSRCQRGSHRRERARKAVARAHRTIRNQRRDFLHKAARSLVNHCGVIVMEDLKIMNMSATPDPKPDPENDGAYLPNGANAKAGLNQSILDAGWGQFQALCVAKAASAGRTVEFMAPHYTSQRCSQCGAIVKKDLAQRWHSCSCGCELDRDHNAAINILLAGKQPTGLRACRSPAL
ncbi:MAG TPA: transposase [Ktedonobacterales bacterium]|nr:transposase [Ktedonobacterales bacterium]